MDKAVALGRIALRTEGEFWNAYFCPETTSMEGALLLGSIRANFAGDPELRSTFTELMKAAFAKVTNELYGKSPEWLTTPGPESERSTRA